MTYKQDLQRSRDNEKSDLDKLQVRAVRRDALKGEAKEHFTKTVQRSR